MEMGGKVGSAPACYSSSLGSNPDISQEANQYLKSQQKLALTAINKLFAL
jgi:hypothetical protein